MLSYPSISMYSHCISLVPFNLIAGRLFLRLQARINVLISLTNTLINSSLSFKNRSVFFCLAFWILGYTPPSPAVFKQASLHLAMSWYGHILVLIGLRCIMQDQYLLDTLLLLSILGLEFTLNSLYPIVPP